MTSERASFTKITFQFRADILSFKQNHIFVRAQIRGPFMQLALGSVLAAFVGRAQAICKSVPGSPGWPPPSEWASLINQCLERCSNLLHQVVSAILKNQTTTRRYVQPSKPPGQLPGHSTSGTTTAVFPTSNSLAVVKDTPFMP